MADKISYTSKMLNNTKNNYIRMIVGALLSFITSVIFARFLGTDVYGTYTYLIWFIGIVANVAGLGLPGTITKFLPQYYFVEDKEEAKNVLLYIIKKQLKLSFFISIGLIVTIPFWKNYVNINESSTNMLLFITCINVLPSVLNSLLMNAIQALQRFDIYAQVSIKTQIISFIINLINLVTIKNIELLILVLLLATLYQNIKYFNTIKKMLNIDKLSLVKDIKNSIGIRKYSISMYINVMWQQIVWTRSEYFFLGIYGSAKDIAIYGVAYSLVGMVNMIFTPIMNVINNYFSEIIAKKDKILLNTIINTVTKYFAIVILFIYVYSYIYIDDFVSLLYTDKYLDVPKIFLIILIGVAANLILCVASSIPFYYEKQKPIIILGIVCGVVNIILDMFLIPNYGVVGAAIANASVQVLFSVVQFIYIYINFEVKLLVKEIVIILTLNAVLFLILINIKIMVFKILAGVILFILYILILNVLKVIDLHMIMSKIRIRK